MCAEDNYKLVKEACKGLACEEGGVNTGKLWKLKRRLQGILVEPPTAMLDGKGNLVTTNSAIENITMEMYRERLKASEIKQDLNVYKMQSDKLCEQRLKEAHDNKTPPWNLEDLEIVLKQLKSSKSPDPLDFANELFQANNAGNDLKLAVLRLMNQIKSQQAFPEQLKYCNITSLYKQKGSKKDFDNYIGIFRVTILRSIMDKLIYIDEYHTIDENLTDSNVGARRGRNIREHIFVLNT